MLYKIILKWAAIHTMTWNFLQKSGDTAEPKLSIILSKKDENTVLIVTSMMN